MENEVKDKKHKEENDLLNEKIKELNEKIKSLVEEKNIIIIEKEKNKKELNDKKEIEEK